MKREDGCLVWLSLVRGLGFSGIQALLDAFGSACAVWDAGADGWAKLVGAANAEKMQALHDQAKINAYVRGVRDQGMHILSMADERYPQALKQVPDAPHVLYAKGRLELMQMPAVGIVGSRDCSAYGAKVTQLFARELSQSGLCIVSGLARGVDLHAHQAALSQGKATIAVLGNGLDIYYPAENADLQQRIGQEGLLLSEYAPGTKARRWQFPVRNRIIAGLCMGVLLPEAGENSGALGTAAYAMEYGREVFTVPGQIFSPMSYETNRLLRTSALVALEPQDVLHGLGHQGPNKRNNIIEDIALPAGLDAEENALIQALRGGGMTANQLAQATGIDISKTNSLLTMLEIRQIIVRTSAGTIELTLQGS